MVRPLFLIAMKVADLGQTYHDPAILKDYWQEIIPWNIYKVDLSGEVVKLTNVEYTSGLPVFSVDGSKILFLRLDFNLINSQLAGADHRLIYNGARMALTTSN